MKLLTVALLLSLSINSIGQETNLQSKFDSIVEEADLLYRYEKSVWLATDILMSDKILKKQLGGYVVYHSNDTVNVSMLNGNQKQVIARYKFKGSDFDIPFENKVESTELTSIESELLNTKNSIIEQLSNSKYDVTIPQDYSPNLILIKGIDSYKLYVIMGTSESGVIPFGNDYLFQTNLNGDITEWQKFHSRIIPTFSEVPGAGKVTSASHSHLKSTPYITATDVCTFRLYSHYTELKEFSVYSPALGLYMKYNLITNKIEIVEK